MISHYWIEFGQDIIVDIRLRMWLVDNVSTPHDVVMMLRDSVWSTGGKQPQFPRLAINSLTRLPKAAVPVCTFQGSTKLICNRLFPLSRDAGGLQSKAEYLGPSSVVIGEERGQPCSAFLAVRPDSPLDPLMQTRLDESLALPLVCERYGPVNVCLITRAWQVPHE
jgi:hypothetical protein